MERGPGEGCRGERGNPAITSRMFPYLQSHEEMLLFKRSNNWKDHRESNGRYVLVDYPELYSSTVTAKLTHYLSK